MAKCSKCGSEFERTAYQVRKCHWHCRSCSRIAEKAYRASRKAAGIPIKPTKMPREWHRNYEVKYCSDPQVKVRRAAQMRSYTKSPAVRSHHIARWKVGRALKAGRLVKQACEVCGARKVQAHHDDYSKPLDVRWLCLKHHSEHHAKAKGEA
jgi:hypothetical protein